jgi:hypothetical protein
MYGAAAALAAAGVMLCGSAYKTASSAQVRPVLYLAKDRCLRVLTAVLRLPRLTG